MIVRCAIQRARIAARLCPMVPEVVLAVLWFATLSALQLADSRGAAMSVMLGCVLPEPLRACAVCRAAIIILLDGATARTARDDPKAEAREGQCDCDRRGRGGAKLHNRL